MAAQKLLKVLLQSLPAHEYQEVVRLIAEAEETGNAYALARVLSEHGLLVIDKDGGLIVAMNTGQMH